MKLIKKAPQAYCESPLLILGTKNKFSFTTVDFCKPCSYSAREAELVSVLANAMGRATVTSMWPES